MTNKIKATANNYLACFKHNTREATGEEFVFLPENAPQELRDAIRNAHGDKLPNDWTYNTFADLLQKTTEYDCDSIDQLEDYRGEIVDSYVDIYTYQLTQWLHDEQALEYLEQASEGFVAEDGAWQLLARAQYLAVDEIMQHVLTLLENNID